MTEEEKMGYILKMLIFHSYGESWWKGIIPIYSDYGLATLACSSVYFWGYMGCFAAAVLFAIIGLLPLAFLAFVLGMIVYSIVLFDYMQSD